MKLYRITDWAKHYEVSDSRKVDGPLSWVAVRTKTDGLGFRRIVSEQDRCELLAAWYLLVGVAAKQPAAERGKIARDGQPLTPDELAMITGFPAQIFERALVFFSQPRQKWLTVSEYTESVRTDSDASGQTPRTGQDRTGHDPSPLSVKNQDEWINSLKRSHHGIDIDAQLRLAAADRKKAGKTLERAWFEQVWLPKASPFVQAIAPANSIPEPSGWREHLSTNYPDAIFLDASSDRYARTWADLPRDYQQKIASELSL